MKLHESIAHTKTEAVIKETNGFRLRLEKHEVTSPKGLYSVNLINETLQSNGDIGDTSTYNFFMTDEELKVLAQELTS